MEELNLYGMASCPFSLKAEKITSSRQEDYLTIQFLNLVPWIVFIHVGKKILSISQFPRVYKRVSLACESWEHGWLVVWPVPSEDVLPGRVGGATNDAVVTGQAFEEGEAGITVAERCGSFF